MEVRAFYELARLEDASRFDGLFDEAADGKWDYHNQLHPFAYHEQRLKILNDAIAGQAVFHNSLQFCSYKQRRISMGDIAIPDTCITTADLDMSLLWSLYGGTIRVMNWFKIRYCEMSLDQLQARLDAYERQHKRYLENGDHELIIAGSARCMLLQDAIRRVDGQGKRKRFDMINWRRPPWGQGLDPHYLSKMGMPLEQQPWPKPAHARTKSHSSILGPLLSGSKCLETGANARPTFKGSHRFVEAASTFKSTVPSPTWSPICRPLTPTEFMRARDEISKANRLLGSSSLLDPEIPEEGGRSSSNSEGFNYFDAGAFTPMEFVPTAEGSPIFALQDITPEAPLVPTDTVPPLEKSLVHIHEDVVAKPIRGSGRGQGEPNPDRLRYDSMSPEPSSSNALQDITPNGQWSSGAWDPKSKTRFYDAEAFSPYPPAQWAPELTRRKFKGLCLATKSSESSKTDSNMSRGRESSPAVDIILSPEDAIDDGDSNMSKDDRQMLSMPQYAYEDSKSIDPLVADRKRHVHRKSEFLQLAPVMRGGHMTGSKKRLASSAFLAGKRPKTDEKEKQEDLYDPESPPVASGSAEETNEEVLCPGWPSESD
ncbi:uncharacterized protein BDZ99DRAFT_458513 [Mytilinidion resinicola]|uniref:Uncharacterized protein n=1 Tax=Mytilinidion resinicola TaxID=574789 RepID=A0A6A6Z6E5_9PEZI|nr:uncharacterized protein BDZ99DRAFT_458513 [Mytilinidion resinicola]KAF2816671.1 hypothetical protein BDZ99DRAFT_458513 [Mytilinidion resinicola]